MGGRDLRLASEEQGAGEAHDYITEDSESILCISCWLWRSNQPCRESPYDKNGLHHTFRGREYHKAWEAADNQLREEAILGGTSAGRDCSQLQPTSLNHENVKSGGGSTRL